MHRSLFTWLLVFFLLVALQAKALDSDEESESPPQHQKKVMFIKLHNSDHELYVEKESGKKGWQKGNEINHTFEQEEEPTLSLQYLKQPNSIQYVIEHTKFTSKSDSNIGEIKFLDAAQFLGKIKSLVPDGASKQYNHLCLTLYATYFKQNKNKIIESPLYAKWVGEPTLSEDGTLKKELKATFYTKGGFPYNGKWAYFTTGSPSHHKKAENDNNIFPVPPTSCYNKDSFSPICKTFYKADTEDTSKIDCDNNSCCAHTEPNALFYVLSHKVKLFSPLIEKAGGIGNVKSIGIRFFSYYEPCLRCLSVLHQNRTLSIANFNGQYNFIFYFYRKYNSDHIIKIKGRLPLKRFTKLFNDGQILRGTLSNDNKTINHENLGNSNILGKIKIVDKVDLTVGNKLLLVHPLEIEDNIDEDETFNIYVTK